MNYSRLENKIEGLRHHESHIDTSEVWAMLEPKLQKEEKKKKIILFFFLGVWISIVALMVLIPILPKNTNTKKTPGSVQTESNIRKTEKGILSAQINSLNHDQVHTETEGAIEKVPVEIQHTNRTLKKQKIETTQENPYFTDSQLSDRSNSKPSETQENIQQYRPRNVAPFEEDIQLTGDSRDSNNAKRDYYSQTNGNLNNLVTPLESNSHAYQLLLLDIGAATLVARAPRFVDCPTINKKSKRFSFSVRSYAAYEFPTTQFKSTGDNLNLETIRSNLESNYVAYSFGVEVRARTASGIHVFTGINQSVIKDQFDYSFQRDTTILIEDFIKNISINENQDSVITIGDTLIGATVFEAGRRFNQYKSIDIPIGIEISKRFAKFELGTSTAALINLTFNTKGSILDENEEYVSINGFYKNKIGIRFRFSTPIQYHVARDLSIGIAPSLIYAPRSLSSENYSIQHKVNLFSMRLFADYKF